MSLDDRFKTKTVADILARQGQWKKAAEIYLFMLKKNPDQPEIKSRLIDIRQRLIQPGQPRLRDLTPLYERWIALGLQHFNQKKTKQDAR